ncbi:phosphomannose isomerase type II C-terminal cupin domain [Nonlabens marinus]|uniref:Mannose-1-phosphate guanylyltransferase n=1 Tax=Nonlabens marinus S1-08 TaxID=1454201 RepID=W8W0Q8_9FLAO|nr:phosphomannose isomerase type II C-terminal cupin domain [Nonlabens marinus]BAO56751.1 mannose-1-phosphate guanylyltransferase [Nonlabens marinus S1-08]
MDESKRPWGQYFILDEGENFKVKRIEVKPGGRLSYQYHHKRSEVWTVVCGVARITLDDATKDYSIGEVVEIPQGVKHRVENAERELLTFIEVQYGTYFGEDDIVRIEDDYQRS